MLVADVVFEEDRPTSALDARHFVMMPGRHGGRWNHWFGTRRLLTRATRRLVLRMARSVMRVHLLLLGTMFFGRSASVYHFPLPDVYTWLYIAYHGAIALFWWLLDGFILA